MRNVFIFIYFIARRRSPVEAISVFCEKNNSMGLVHLTGNCFATYARNDIIASSQNAPVAPLLHIPFSNARRCWFHFPTRYPTPFPCNLSRVPIPPRRAPFPCQVFVREYVRPRTMLRCSQRAKFHIPRCSRGVPLR